MKDHENGKQMPMADKPDERYSTMVLNNATIVRACVEIPTNSAQRATETGDVSSAHDVPRQREV